MNEKTRADTRGRARPRESGRSRRADFVGPTRLGHSWREMISEPRRSRDCDEKCAPLNAEWLRFAVKNASRSRTPSQVADASRVQPRGRLPQLLSTRGKEPTEQATCAQLLQASPPALCTAPQPIEDSRQFRRDRGLPVAKQPPRVIDQKQVASSENPSSMPSREESNRRLSSIGHSHSESSRPATACEPATS
jgi:hypothetical protein